MPQTPHSKVNTNIILVDIKGPTVISGQQISYITEYIQVYPSWGSLAYNGTTFVTTIDPLGYLTSTNFNFTQAQTGFKNLVVGRHMIAIQVITKDSAHKIAWTTPVTSNCTVAFEFHEAAQHIDQSAWAIIVVTNPKNSIYWPQTTPQTLTTHYASAFMQATQFFLAPQ